MWKKVGAVVGAIVAILGLLVTVAAYISSREDATVRDVVRVTESAGQAIDATVQAAQNVILKEQLHVQQEMATLQAGTFNSGPTATAIAKRVTELQGTAVALATQEARIQIKKVSTATPPAAYIASGTFLFEEDFEDGKVQGIGFSGDPQWRFVTDETGNKVYEIDNRDGTDYKGFSFGVDEWKNYRVEYRARFLESTLSKSELGLQVRSDGHSYYVLILGEEEMYLAYSINGSEWTRLITQFPTISRDTWYRIKVDVQGE